MKPNPTQPLRLTLVQISAGIDRPLNLAAIERMLTASRPTDLIALPEVFALRGSDEDYRRQAEPVGGPLTEWLAALARHHRAWVLAGSMIERAKGGPFNTTLLLNRDGNVVAKYRKIHLFEAEILSGRVIRERDTYRAGSKPVMTDIEGWMCGLSICYDLRFPELYRLYSARGAHILFAPSNFTQRTGKDHWEVLVRARAIENQSFVVAPDQCGANPATKIRSHGHSMVAGPWGEVLCAARNNPCALSTVLDPRMLEQTRKRVPALKHRRL